MLSKTKKKKITTITQEESKASVNAITHIYPKDFIDTIHVMLPPFQNSNKLYIQNRLVTYIDALHSRNYSSPRTL